MATVGYGDGGPAAPMGTPPGCPGPPPTCHDAPQPLHQLDGCSHGAPSFNPLVHEEDAQTWEGTKAAAECPVPVPAAAPHDRSTPLAHPARWRRCGPPSPSLGPSSRCRAASASARRGARLCGWPGNLSVVWRRRQRLGVGMALSGPQGRGMGTQRSPASPLTQDEAHGINASHHVNGVSLEGLQQVSHAVLQALGRENGGAGCPQPTVGTCSPYAGARGHDRVPRQPRGGAAHPGTLTGAIPPRHWVLAGDSRAGRGPARRSWDP